MLMAGLLAVGGPTGLVQCKSSAKPLVPYAVGGSVNQGTGMSRFATAHATSEAVAPIQNAASAVGPFTPRQISCLPRQGLSMVMSFHIVSSRGDLFEDCSCLAVLSAFGSSWH